MRKGVELTGFDDWTLHLLSVVMISIKAISIYLEQSTHNIYALVSRNTNFGALRTQIYTHDAHCDCGDGDCRMIRREAGRHDRG